MSGVLIALLFVPFAAGLIGSVLGRRVAAPLAVLGSLAALVLATILLFEVGPSGGDGPAAEVFQEWIPALGINFHVAVDGLNAVLVEMTCFVWFLGTLWSLRDRELATPTYLLLLGLAQSAILVAFVAQDLMLFVLCFDLMLLPFVLIAASAAPQGESGLAPGDQAARLHAGRLAPDARRGRRARGPVRPATRHADQLRPRHAGRDHARYQRAEVGARRLPGRLPDQDADRAFTGGCPTPTAPCRCRRSRCSVRC